MHDMAHVENGRKLFERACDVSACWLEPRLTELVAAWARKRAAQPSTSSHGGTTRLIKQPLATRLSMPQTGR